LGLSTEVLVRSAAEWAAIVAGNPFTKAAASDPAHLVVMLLKGEADPAAVAALRESIAGPELLHAEGRQAYIVYPAGIGRSKLTMAKLERGLGSRGTGRNWNTVLKLAAPAGG
ncbi:MAG TPA: DUF1697 domain-containing protein, partial [Alphaproteobacteria bacterium]|nr:DUF1697 domain-containing protein [Alphaproteobacteria bacterium]